MNPFNSSFSPTSVGSNINKYFQNALSTIQSKLKDVESQLASIYEWEYSKEKHSTDNQYHSDLFTILSKENVFSYENSALPAERENANIHVVKSVYNVGNSKEISTTAFNTPVEIALSEKKDYIMDYPNYQSSGEDYKDESETLKTPLGVIASATNNYHKEYFQVKNLDFMDEYQSLFNTAQRVMDSATTNYTEEYLDRQKSVEDFKDEYQNDRFYSRTSYDYSKQFHQFPEENHEPTFGMRELHVSKHSKINLTQSISQSAPLTKKNSWIWHRGKKGFVPPKTSPVAKTRTGFPVYAGRVSHEDNIIPATVLAEKGVAYYSWRGKVFRTTNYEVLEIHHFAWKDEGSGHESLHAFPIGRTSDGTPLFLGRMYIEGMGPWVGWVHRDDNHIFLAFRGNELRIPKPYELFVAY